MKIKHILGLALALPLSLSSLSHADLKENDLATSIQQDYDNRLGALYTHFHRNPELSFIEFKTAKKLANELRSSGFEVTEKVGGTGVVAILKNGDGPLVMMRGDMDALPVEEKSGLEYASKATQSDPITGKEVPVMHACGHDGHTTMLLAAAQHLAQHRHFDGTVYLIFQPAEEDGAGGQVMVQESIMDRFEIDQVYGIHNAPNLLSERWMKLKTFCQKVFVKGTVIQRCSKPWFNCISLQILIMPRKHANDLHLMRLFCCKHF